jgi:hypothetical protein
MMQNMYWQKIFGLRDFSENLKNRCLANRLNQARFEF